MIGINKELLNAYIRCEDEGITMTDYLFKYDKVHLLKELLNYSDNFPKLTKVSIFIKAIAELRSLKKFINANDAYDITLDATYFRDTAHDLADAFGPDDLLNSCHRSQMEDIYFDIVDTCDRFIFSPTFH